MRKIYLAVLGYGIGLVFLLAGLSKISHLADFIGSFPHPVIISTGFSTFGAVLLISFETVLGFWLLEDIGNRYIASIAMLTFAVFFLYAACRLLPGFDQVLSAARGCHCFELQSVRELEFSQDKWIVAARDLGFLIMACAYWRLCNSRSEVVPLG